MALLPIRLAKPDGAVVKSVVPMRQQYGVGENLS